MNTSLRLSIKLAPVAAACVILVACGGATESESIDPNAAEREDAELRLDRAVPNLVIATPTTQQSYSTTRATVTLAGSATDDRKISKITWVNDRGGNGVAAKTGTWGTATWTASSLPLAA